MLKFESNPARRVLAQFAWFALVGMPLIAGFALRLAGSFTWSHPVLLAAGGVAAAQLLLFLLGVSAPSRWLFVGLSVVFMPLGFVISQVLMALVFYAVITPIGLLMRAVGRDKLGKGIDRSAGSYWHDRGPPRSPASYFKLY